MHALDFVKMLKFLLLFGSSLALYNESCNALDLSKVCEDECNTEMNICFANSGGDYDKIHICLRDHESCFEDCPCHFNCLPGCPCASWECPQVCEDIWGEEAGRCKDICDAQVCSCVKDCDTFDNSCVQDCVEDHVHCLQRCPCGKYCPDGCPCDGFCDEQANHTALIISEWGSKVEQVPNVFKWVVDEHWFRLPNYPTGEHHVGHGSCHVTFKGQFYIIGGGGKYAADDMGDNKVSRVGPCGLEEIEQAQLPTLEEGQTKYGWAGHSCAVVNYDTGDDRVMVCSPYWPANGRDRCWYIKDVKENWEELTENDIAQFGHGNGAMVYVKNRAYLIGGVDTNSEANNPDYGDESGTHNFEFYTPRLGDVKGWTSLQNLPRAVKDHAALAYDRWIYVFGGVIHENTEHMASKHVWSFEVDGDESNNNWVRHRDMALPRFGFSAIISTPRQIMLIGGHDELSEVDTFPEDFPSTSSPMPIEKWTNEQPAPLLDANGVFKEPIWLDEQVSEHTLDRYMYPAVFMVNNQWLQWELNYDCDVVPVV